MPHWRREADALAERWRAGKTTLLAQPARHPALPRAAQIADAALGIVMAAATLNYTLKGGDAPIGPETAYRPIPGFVPETLAPHRKRRTVAGDSGDGVRVGAGFPTPVPAGHILGGTRRDPVAACGVVTQTARYLPSRLPDRRLQRGDVQPVPRAAITSIVVGAGLIGVRHDATVPQVTAGYVPFLIIIGIGLAANTAHTWKQRLTSVQAEQEASTRQAVEHERARIARELHDVVTHNVSGHGGAGRGSAKSDRRVA